MQPTASSRTATQTEPLAAPHRRAQPAGTNGFERYPATPTHLPLNPSTFQPGWARHSTAASNAPQHLHRSIKVSIKNPLKETQKAPSLLGIRSKRGEGWLQRNQRVCVEEKEGRRRGWWEERAFVGKKRARVRAVFGGGQTAKPGAKCTAKVENSRCLVGTGLCARGRQAATARGSSETSRDVGKSAGKRSERW